MPTISKIKAGHKSRNSGFEFESLIINSSRQIGASIIKIPDSCRPTKRWSGGSFSISNVRIPSPFDFVLMLKGRAFVFDAKSTSYNTFAKSQIDQKQLANLTYCASNSVAGYVVWFKELDRVRFFSSLELQMVKKQSSLSVSDGIGLGTGLKIDLSLVFSKLDLDAANKVAEP